MISESFYDNVQFYQGNASTLEESTSSCYFTCVQEMCIRRLSFKFLLTLFILIISATHLAERDQG